MSANARRKRTSAKAADGLSDPIFAAIDRFLQADKKCRPVSDRRMGRKRSAAQEEATAAYRSCLQELAETAPTTLAGLAAYARFLNEQSVAIENPFFDGDEQYLTFHASLDRSLELIMRGAVPIAAGRAK